MWFLRGLWQNFLGVEYSNYYCVFCGDRFVFVAVHFTDHTGIFSVPWRSIFRKNRSTDSKERWGIFLNSLFFVVGFSIVFVVPAFERRSLAYVTYAVQTWLSWIGGVVIIFFGLYLMGFFKIGFLEYDHKLSPKINLRSRYLTSLLFGFAFAAGWDAVRRTGFGAAFSGTRSFVARRSVSVTSFLRFRPRRTVSDSRCVRLAGCALDQPLCRLRFTM